ncbi:MAG: type II 3-dehydroquinate dehydratase [Bacteroidales bacterium]|nr:type II 3-dehydroquinate dehydratase [Bacteroidales bacterium]
MKHIEIINGPNLNLTGRREPEVYGSTTMEEYVEGLRARFPEVEITYYQSNVEGELIDRIQQVVRVPAAGNTSIDGLIVNLGGYSHTSVALRDALLAVPAPKVEVHLSNIFAREEYRHHSLITSACRGMVCGLGLQGYELALRALV